MFILFALVVASAAAWLWVKILSPMVSEWVAHYRIRKMNTPSYAAFRLAKLARERVALLYRQEGLWSGRASSALKAWCGLDELELNRCVNARYRAAFLRTLSLALKHGQATVRVLDEACIKTLSLRLVRDETREDVVYCHVEEVERGLELASLKWGVLTDAEDIQAQALLFLRVMQDASCVELFEYEKAIAQLSQRAEVAACVVANNVICLRVEPAQIAERLEDYVFALKHEVRDLLSDSLSVADGYWLPGWLFAVLGEAKVFGLVKRWRYKASDFNGLEHASFDQGVPEHVVESLGLPRVRFALQPVVDIRQGSVCGFELLCRGLDEAGEVPAADLLRLYGLHGCDFYILSKALETSAWMLNALTLNESVKFIVNVDAKMLGHSRFFQHLSEGMLRFSINPRRLVIELVEDSSIASYSQIEQSISKIRSLGVDLSIDDFGRGFSSISRVANLEWTCIKFEADIFFAPDASPFIRKVYAEIKKYAKSRGAKVVLERVESADELLRILDEGNEVDCVQGYCFAKPMYAEEIFDSYKRLQQEIKAKLSGLTQSHSIYDISHVDVADLEGMAELAELTPKERMVLLQVVKGKDYTAIAIEQGINYATIAWHMKKIFVKLGVCNKTEAVSYVTGLLMGDGKSLRAS